MAAVSREKLRRPRRHLFSTFEGRLPCRYVSIGVDPSNLVLDAPASRRKAGKPVLICVFCRAIEAYDSLQGYWGHLVNVHDGVDTSRRSDEIRRTASEWKIYWDETCDGGNQGHVTKQRLVQARQADFDWDAVLAWELR